MSIYSPKPDTANEPLPPYQGAYDTWKADPSPENATTLLGHMEPIMGAAVNRYAGKDDPLIRSRARRMTLDAFRTFDPSRGAKLTTHVMNHLQGLRRASRQQQQFLKVPERAAMEQAYMQRMEAELQERLGREPSTTELADYSGLPMPKIARLRKYVPGAAESSLSDEASVQAPLDPYEREIKIAELLHGELTERDQKIMEWSLGMYGSNKISNQEIASRLGVTPGAVSQRKALIQQRLDAMHNFMGPE
jgi:DNA-directed RNA polymerase specialized sigma subunit